MENNFNDDVYQFVKACNNFGVRMIMVGGSAVNYYGFKRHSADIDFWVDTTIENLDNLLLALKSMGYEFDKFPNEVIDQKQNISLKFSPDLEIELLTSFNPGKTFEQAFAESVEFVTKGQKHFKWNIISFNDLISSKIKSGRAKDLIDVQELQRIRKVK